MKMQLQELVYNRLNMIRSQVGSVSTFGCICFSYISSFFSNLCVYSVQCRQKVKLSNGNVHSSTCIIVEHKREKECYNYVCVQFSVGPCQWIHTCVHMYVLVCVRVCQGVYICVTVSKCRRGVGVSCVLVCRRRWMLSRLQLGTAMVHVQCRKQQGQATYKLNGHTLKTSSVTLVSISMSSRLMKQAISTCIVLGCQSEQEVQGIFRFI